ncbi:response regulator transcription factor [Maritimibacter sp. 55A14]|uniref:helix-turn-helix transcriptional regulator n=1 Tax=Maritimibacter sp. 55A14 TaxID=2174844 RepID=UPI0013048D7D|nr:response regulator transcription factor [Maritimibacter sp. 55A14]
MKIVIACSRKLICDSVQLIVASLDGCEVLGQAARLDEAQALIARAGGPVTLIAAARLEDGDVCDLMRACRKAGHRMRTVVLTNANELNFARDALKAGAAAVCLVDDIHSGLPPILQTVEENVVTMSAPLLARILQQDADRLTKREHEIMELLAEGLTNFQISARLGLSQNTVKYYLKAIYQKLDVTSRGAAIASYLAGEY